ncbi:unnamed protein product [Mytilus coruscus]|uniref:G-protein coupled receptors family 1 profile domain-containing protein n=1 Tax=Mytilus coruscus TaxID=42192 RepID=A0A6J8CXF8_MYTCO|nr:unnamed protein product [Mytilus coruscus]
MSEESCYTVQYLVPEIWNVYSQITFAGLLMILNTFLVIVFSMHCSPVTILLSVLAVTDTLTALFLTIPNVTGYYFFYNELERSYGYYFNGWYWERKFPLCAVLFVIEGLIYTSHMISVVITTLLCIQKALVMRFPRWGKRHLNKAMSFRIVSVAILCTCFLYIPSMVHGMMNMSRGVNDTCCFSQDHLIIHRINEPIASIEDDHTTSTSTSNDWQTSINQSNDWQSSNGIKEFDYWISDENVSLTSIYQSNWQSESGSGTEEFDNWISDEETSNHTLFQITTKKQKSVGGGSIETCGRRIVMYGPFFTRPTWC